MEAKEVQTQAWLAAAAGAELRGLFCFGDCLCFEYAHVGADCFSAVVLFWLWLHGHDEFAAKGKRQTSDRGFGNTGKSELTYSVSEPRAVATGSTTRLVMKAGRRL